MVSTANDAYNILNLPVETCMEDILIRYKCLSLKWHPDKNNRSDESYETFNKLSHAFLKLYYPNRQITSNLEAEMFTIFEDVFINDRVSLDLFCADKKQSERSSDSEFFNTDDDEDDLENYRNHKMVDLLVGDNSDAESVDKPTVSKRTSEEAQKNADDLVAEEEKEKKKAEKRRAKKKRQREKKKKEKELLQQKDDGDDSSNLNSMYDSTVNSRMSSEMDTESEEELDTNSAFVANVKNKLNASVVSTKPENSVEEGFEKANNVKAIPVQPAVLSNDGQGNVNESLILESRKHAIRANQYANNGNFEAAIEFFTEAIKLNPHDSRYYGNRSFCYDKIHKYQQALADSKQALFLNNTSPKNYFRLGRALAGLNQLAEARSAYETALKMDPSCKDAQEELVNIETHRIMEMGFTRYEASASLHLHRSVDKAVESLIANKSETMRESRIRSYFSDEDEPKNNAIHYDKKMDPSNPEGYKSIWIGNVSKSLTESVLEKLFSPFGSIESMRVLPDKHCAFINFKDKKSAALAMKTMQGHSYDRLKFLIRYPNTPVDSYGRKNSLGIGPRLSAVVRR